MGFNALDCAAQVGTLAGFGARLGPYGALAGGGVALLASDSCLGAHTDPGTYTQTVSNPTQGYDMTYTNIVAPPGESGSMSVTVDYGAGGYTTETWSDDGSHTMYDSQTDTLYGLNGDSSWVISSGSTGDSGSGTDGTAGKAAIGP